MGFEPTEGYKPSQHFQCCALNHLDHLSGCLNSILQNRAKIKTFFKNFPNSAKSESAKPARKGVI